jgi:hypothetical protein
LVGCDFTKIFNAVDDSTAAAIIGVRVFDATMHSVTFGLELRRASPLPCSAGAMEWMGVVLRRWESGTHDTACSSTARDRLVNSLTLTPELMRVEQIEAVFCSQARDFPFAEGSAAKPASWPRLLYSIYTSRTDFRASRIRLH